MKTGPMVGVASKGLLQDNLVDVDSLRMVVEYGLELLDISLYCQQGNLALGYTAVVVASAVPLVRNR